MRSELALFESAATRDICQMRSAPAANWTRQVGSIICARYRLSMSLTLRGLGFNFGPVKSDTVLLSALRSRVAQALSLGDSPHCHTIWRSTASIMKIWFLMEDDLAEHRTQKNSCGTQFTIRSPTFISCEHSCCWKLSLLLLRAEFLEGPNQIRMKERGMGHTAPGHPVVRTQTKFHPPRKTCNYI